MALDQQSNFLEKVDHTVDYGFKSWPTVDSCIIFQKIATVATRDLTGPNYSGPFPEKVDCQFFVDFASWILPREKAEFEQNLKIFKIFKISR